LSKRKGALPMTDYRDMGYLPETMINYMAFLGWNPGTEQEIMSFGDILIQFSLDKVQKSGAIFNIEKLDWFNKKYIEKMTLDEFTKSANKFIPENISPKLLPLIKEKISKYSEIEDLLEGELSFINPLNEYSKESLKWKQEKDLVNTKEYLRLIIEKLIGLNDFSKESIKIAIWPLAEEKGKGNVLWPMRYALSGKEKSPDPFTIAEILGNEETIKRLAYAHRNI
jgi:glutamyl/glutaminyl-tRNA synthetase